MNAYSIVSSPKARGNFFDNKEISLRSNQEASVILVETLRY